MGRKVVRAAGALVAAGAVVLAGSVAWAAGPSPSSGPVVGGTVVTVPCTAGGAVVGASAQVGSTSAAQEFRLSDGRVLAFGWNDSGQLGDGTTSGASQGSPTTVVAGAMPAGVTITQTAVGGTATYALGSDGHVYVWGSSTYGLGAGSTMSSPSPVPLAQGAVPAGVTFTQVAASADTGYALGSDGHVYSWGAGYAGQLGNGTQNSSTVPVAVSAGAIPAGVTITSLATTDGGPGTAHALGSDGRVYSWGADYMGLSLLGVSSPSSSSTPVVAASGQVPAGVTVTAMAGGFATTYLLGSDGRVYSWGPNTWGQLGNGTTTDSTTAVAVAQGAVPAGVTFTKVVGYSSTALAVGSDGNLYGWGANASGSVPVRLPAGALPAGVSITGLSGGAGGGVYLIGSDGSVYTWNGSTSAGPELMWAFAPTGVTFGGVPGTGFTVNGDGTCSAATPAGTAGPVNVEVTSALQYMGTSTPVTSSVTYPAGYTYVAAPVFATTSLPSGTVGTGYTGPVSVTSSVPVTCTVSSGTLPAGVSLDPATCQLSGTPSVAGSFPFTLTATNPGGSASQAFTLVVAPAPTVTPTPTPTATPTVTPTPTATPTPTVTSAPSFGTGTLADGAVGVGYSQPLGVTGTGPVTCTITSGALPAGVVLNASTCTLSGTPSAAGTYAFTVSATGPGGTTTHDYRFAVVAALAKTGLDGAGALALLGGLLLAGGGLLLLAARTRKTGTTRA